VNVLELTIQVFHAIKVLSDERNLMQPVQVPHERQDRKKAGEGGKEGGREASERRKMCARAALSNSARLACVHAFAIVDCQKASVDQ
jgi:hypothetical protein